MNHLIFYPADCHFNIILEYLYDEYPDKIKSLGFEKMHIIEGRLWGIKGQYLLFDDGSVLNIRKHNGYNVSLES